MLARPSWNRVVAAALLLLLSVATLTSAQNLFPANGNAGIGTTNPPAPLTIMSTPAAEAIRVIGRSNYGMDEANVMLFKRDGSTYHGAVVGANGTLNLMGGAGGIAVTVTESRNVGIRTTNPTRSLHVEGSSYIKDFLVLGSDVSPVERLHVVGGAYVSGNVKVDGNIAAKYQDVAEWVPARPGLSDGTVLVVDRDRGNHVLASSTPYDTGVAGVVSTQPGILLGQPGSEKVKVSHNGRVKVKVDAGYGAVKIGDLLVTSSTAGYAMRSVPVEVGGTVIHRPGTILGKALEQLESGQGEILVLLTLQ